MLRIFITTHFDKGKNREEIEQLCLMVKQAGFEDFCFIRDVENYEKVFDDAQELMKRTAEEIQKSDYLLLDMTEKPTGRAVEAGIAYAMGRKSFLLLRKGQLLRIV